MSWLSEALGTAEGVISSIIPHEHAADKRAKAAAMEAANAQMAYYTDAKEKMHAESERVNEERHEQRKQINEKQIRSMRRAFRSPGFMEGPTSGESDKLG